MIKLCIKGSQIKTFMNEFLKGTAFDFYGVKHMEVFSAAKFETDGKINPDFLPEKQERDYCLWSELKPYAFALIKGKIKPKVFRTVLALPEDKLGLIHENAASLHLTISFENDSVTFLTGGSQKKFTLDKEVDRAWDGYIKKLLLKLGYDCEASEL
ncbi:MAG: DUF5721 family protein [Clostridiales bacterium]|nr:DUF5721 family protein [Clostridiales bacterium]